jgi:hypothetical protein
MGGTFLGMCLALSAPAQDAPVSSVVPTATTTPVAGQKDAKPVPSADSAAKHSPIVDEIANMVQAGVSAEVMKSYIENWPTPYNLNATDIIALKERSVPDDVTTALVKRGAVLSMQAGEARNLKAQVQSGGNQSYFALDPEGYNYFQYYYLYPRTLASANQRFYSPHGSSYGYSPYAYGYAPAPFYPLPPSAFRRR